MTVLNRPSELSTFEIASINGAPPRNIVTLLEEYLAKERELAVWSFPHFIRYLRALIFKLTPRPHRCVQRILTALGDGSMQTPLRLRQLQSDPPRGPGAGRTAREAANAICEIVGYAAGYVGTTDMRLDNERECYNRALDLAKEVERDALDAGLTPDDLFQCAVTANVEGVLDPDRRDAALAAITAGHFKLAHEIATGA